MNSVMSALKMTRAMLERQDSHSFQAAYGYDGTESKQLWLVKYRACTDVWAEGFFTILDLGESGKYKMSFVCRCLYLHWRSFQSTS